ncbi:hypothetical protein Pmi06nite_64320 [Planotetraspora mira]|uniref:Alpha-L-arabinofuranosidase n=1 Tax=Planotetraspora mira TaxID=58121 RepID=A0A8J3X9M4_9ACTN|nr:hypothetical protein Pmi06nite_64320 [Planotetraspora mira]
MCSALDEIDRADIRYAARVLTTLSYNTDREGRFMTSTFDEQHHLPLPKLNRRGFLGVGAAAGTAVVLSGLAAPAASAATAQRTDDGGKWNKRSKPSRGYRMTAQALGVNTTSGDGNFADAVVPGLLADAHIGLIRYPGGSGADNANWKAPTGSLPWPKYMALMAQIGSAPMITINYGTLAQGPDSAAAWVGSALTFPNYDSTTAIWVLGNEGYGPWERDQHPDPHTPASYATNVRPYFVAMHAVDPATRVGFPMTIDRTVAAGTGTWVADPDLWNRTVLKQNADQVDFIDFHWYPIFGIPVLSNAQLFETVDRIPHAMDYLRSIIDEYDPNTPIVVSESNISQSEIVYNCQPVAALYAVATALTWLSQGADSYMWWQVHNSDNMNGDFGFLSNGSGNPGPSATTLATAVTAGARNIAVASTAGFYYGHQFTVDTGATLESRKITAIGGSATLAVPVAKGDKNLKVSSIVPFAPGTPITIDTGSGLESRTVASVGTGADSGLLAAPASAGDKTIRIVGRGMGGQSIPVFMPIGFAPGGTVTVGTGTDAETATIESVGTSSSLGTTLVAPASVGDKTLYVASVSNSNNGIANYVGDPITIGSAATEEVRTITGVGSGAAAVTTVVAPLSAGTRTVFLASVTGVTVGHPLMVDTGADQEIVSTIASVGAQTATTLAAAAAAGATNVKVTSNAGLLAGHLITIDTGANRETFTISSVGSGGPTGSGISLSGPLTLAHALGAAAVDVGTGVILSHPVTVAHAAGVAAQDIGSGITLSAPLKQAHPIGTPTRDAGSGLTLTKPLHKNHPDGATVSTPGTGITLSEALTSAHDTAAAVVSTGITFTPALGNAHPAGATVNELGLKEPPLNTPMPAYWGFVLASLMTKPGAYLTEVTPSSPSTVRAFASYLDGTQSICLVNTDDVNPVTFRVNGIGHGGTLKTYDYGLLNPSIVEGTTTFDHAADGLVLAPESIRILVGSVAGSQPKVSVEVRH